MISLLPQGVIQHDLPLEAPPETSLGTDFATNFELGSRHNMLGDELLRGKKLAYSLFAPGERISHDQWKNDPSLFRPGLDFPKEGGTTSSARINADAYDREGYLADVINNARSGIVPTSVGFLGNVLGFAADPNNIAGEFAAAELMGPMRAVVSRALANSSKAANVGAEVAMGAVQHGAAFTPAAMADYDVSNQLGQNPTALGVMANIGIASALGATFHGIGAFRKPITTEAHDTALQTSAQQFWNDQRTDVGPILKQGYNDARTNERTNQNVSDYVQKFGQARDAKGAAEFEAKNAEAKAGLQQRVDETSADVASKETALNTAVDEQTIRQKNRGLLESKEELPTDSELIDKTLKINEIPPVSRSLEDNLFLKSLPKNEEFQQALATEQKPGFQRTPEENIALRGFRNGEEPQQIAQRLEDQQKQLADLNQQLSNIKELDSKKGQELKAQIADINDRVKAGEDRLQELAGHGNDEPPVREARKNFEAAKAEHEAAKQNLETHNVEGLMRENPVLPVTHDEIAGSVERTNDWRNDTSLDPRDMAAADKEAEAVPENNEAILAETEALINDLKKQDALTEADKKILDDLEKETEKSGRYQAALKALRDCFLGGGK